MEVYNILRMYYRMKGKHEIADEYPARVDAFLEGRTVKNASAKYSCNILQKHFSQYVLPGMRRLLQDIHRLSHVFLSSGNTSEVYYRLPFSCCSVPLYSDSSIFLFFIA